MERLSLGCRGSWQEQGPPGPSDGIQGLSPRISDPSHWGFGWPSRACSSCIMPECARPNPCPRGLFLAGTGVPSGFGGLGSGGSTDWRSLCWGADRSASGGGLGGSSCGAGAGVRRKEGRERRCEELRERSTRLRGTETSRRDPGSRASFQLLQACSLALPVVSAASAASCSLGSAFGGSWIVGCSFWPFTSSRPSG